MPFYCYLLLYKYFICRFTPRINFYYSDELENDQEIKMAFEEIESQKDAKLLRSAFNIKFPT